MGTYTYTYTMHKSQHLNQRAFDYLPGQGLRYDGKFGKRSFETRSPSHLRLIAIHAQGRRKKTEYEYATLDDDYPEPSSGNFSLDNLNLPQTSGFVLRTLQNFVDRFVDIVFDFAPQGVSRAVVETTTKGALVLVSLAFASSILSFLLNAGFVALGLYVASKVLNVDLGSKVADSLDANTPPSPPGGQAQRRDRTTRARPQRKMQPENSDVTDVWFERPARKQKG